MSPSVPKSLLLAAIGWWRPGAGYWPRRVRRHALIAAGALGLTAALAIAPRAGPAVFRVSLGTGYAALLLLGLSLALGPLNVLRGRPNPVSSDLRRDVGIWTAVFGLAHVISGALVHMGGRVWPYFFYPADQPHRFPLRHDPFGAANWLGLGATMVLVLLLAISNDLSLRRLGTPRWKALQRWNYALAALTLLHGAAYQLVESQKWPFVLLLAATATAALLLQGAGFLRMRRSSEPIA